MAGLVWTPGAMVIVTMWYSDRERQISDPDLKTLARRSLLVWAIVRTDPDKSALYNVQVVARFLLSCLIQFEDWKNKWNPSEVFKVVMYLCDCKVPDKGFWGSSICDPPPGASLHQAGPRERRGAPAAARCSRPGAARSGLQDQNQVSPLIFLF